MIINKVFVESSKEPDKRLIWIKEGILYYFGRNRWKPIKASGDTTTIEWEGITNKPFYVTEEGFQSILDSIKKNTSEIEVIKTIRLSKIEDRLEEIERKNFEQDQKINNLNLEVSVNRENIKNNKVIITNSECEIKAIKEERITLEQVPKLLKETVILKL